MSLFDLLLEEHAALLKARGYDEQSLNSPDKKGLLLLELRRNLSLALRDSLLDDTPYSFELRATGFFNGLKNVIVFRFHYEADATKGTLDIKELTLCGDGVVRRLSLQTSYNLPASSESLRLLEQQKQFDQARNARYVPVHTTRKSSGKSP